MEDVKIIESASKGRLLFIYKTVWQRRLLERYANELCLPDATYKTTQYSLPLFFLVVETNVDCQVVGSFIVQDETSSAIMEALNVIRTLSREWKPG